MVPSRHRRQASALLQEFDKRGNEITYNSNGTIFIDQTSIPQSDIFRLFPYLFKQKHPKDLNGFDDFVQKIQEMGLDHLIFKRSASKGRASASAAPNQESKSDDNWWLLI